MDWTSVFEEDGSEDLVIPLLMDKKQTTSRLSRLVSRVYLHHHRDDEYGGEDESLQDGHRLLDLPQDNATGSSYSLRAVYYLSINYILGVGCLGIPYAFARAGFLLCSLILTMVTIFSYMTVMWVAETGARFEQQCKRTSELKAEQTSLLHHVNELGGRQPRYEVIDLIQFYLGGVQKMIYQLSLMALMYIGLLAYSQVFCGAIAALLPGNGVLVGLPQLIFGIMVVPLSCMDLEEQLSMQSLMAAVRFVAIAVVVLGSLFALFVDQSHSFRDNPPFFAPPDDNGCKMSYMACFDGFGIAFSTCMFSQLFQHSIPGLLRPLNDQPAQLRQAPGTFAASLLTTSSFYFLLGLSAASYFGAATRSSINLNFADFVFGLDPASLPHWLMVALHLLSSVVVIFPALDTISVFPLIANTLGNNLYASAGPSFIKFLAKWMVATKARLKDRGVFLGPSMNERYLALSIQERQKALELSSKTSSILWRLVAAIPPLILSLVASDLSFSFLLAGVAGIHVAFLAPSMLQLKSQALSHETTMFHGWYSSTLLCYPVVAFATFSFCVVLIQIRDAVL